MKLFYMVKNNTLLSDDRIQQSHLFKPSLFLPHRVGSLYGLYKLFNTENAHLFSYFHSIDISLDNGQAEHAVLCADVW